MTDEERTIIESGGFMGWQFSGNAQGQPRFMRDPDGRQPGCIICGEPAVQAIVTRAPQVFCEAHELLPNTAVTYIDVVVQEMARLRGWRAIAEKHLSNQLALERENAAWRGIGRKLDAIDRDATGAIVTDSLYVTDCSLCHRRITSPDMSEFGGQRGHRDDCPLLVAPAPLASES